MIRKLLLIVFMLTAFGKAHSQSLSLDDLIQSTKGNYNEAADYLTKTKGFRLIDSKTLYGTTIMQFNRIIESVQEFVVKSQLEGNDHVIHPTLHYEAKFSNKYYADTLIKQLEIAGFKCTEKDTDQRKKNWVFTNDKYTASIYVFNDKVLPWEIEIHGL